MLQLPTHIHVIFILTTVVTAFFLAVSIWKSNSPRVKRKTHMAALLMLLWLIFLAALALNKYFLATDNFPPHIGVPVLITLACMAILFIAPRGRRFLDGLSMQTLTWLHIVRIPVEYVLWQLAIEKQIPLDMTFEGMNFDILSGLTAPVVAWLYFTKKAFGKKMLVVWNILALLLLINVVTVAVLSVPSPLQQLNFDQPNWAVLHFPFAWLPGFIVPAVLFSHLVCLCQLLKKPG